MRYRSFFFLKKRTLIEMWIRLRRRILTSVLIQKLPVDEVLQILKLSHRRSLAVVVEN